MNNDDPATVEAGGPAYLLMIDGLLRDDPENESLLCSASALNAFYANVFVNAPHRTQKMTDKALGYALRATSIRKPGIRSLQDVDFQTFAEAIAAMEKKDLSALYTLGVAWAGWIHAHREDWNAVAAISRVEAIMQRVIELDETYRDGEAHIYIGTLATLLPAGLGGAPETGRIHFERAIEISHGKNLMMKVTYARQYARLIFDRELHDRLLNEVLRADYDLPGYVLMNVLAQKQAQELLDSADNYF